MKNRIESAVLTLLPMSVGGLVLGAISYLASSPFLTPPLGASIYVCVRARGLAPAAPRRVIVSHVVGVLCGDIGRWLFSVTSTGISGPVVGWTNYAAAVVALVLTAFFLEITDSMHPPACATTLVVGYGLVDGFSGEAAMIGAAVILALMVAMRDSSSSPVTRPAGSPP